MKSYKNLVEFVNAAVKSRKYNENSAQGLRAALRLFEVELNEEERASIDLVKERIEQIYGSVFSKNSGELSSDSLKEYKRRVQKVINDYEEYGSNPTKFANWQAKLVARAPRKKAPSANLDGFESADNESGVQLKGVNRTERIMENGGRAVIMTPIDITAKDVSRLKAILDTLVDAE